MLRLKVFLFILLNSEIFGQLNNNTVEFSNEVNNVTINEENNYNKSDVFGDDILVTTTVKSDLNFEDVIENVTLLDSNITDTKNETDFQNTNNETSLVTSIKFDSNVNNSINNNIKNETDSQVYNNSTLLTISTNISNGTLLVKNLTASEFKDFMNSVITKKNDTQLFINNASMVTIEPNFMDFIQIQNETKFQEQNISNNNTDFREILKLFLLQEELQNIIKNTTLENLEMTTNSVETSTLPTTKIKRLVTTTDSEVYDEESTEDNESIFFNNEEIFGEMYSTTSLKSTTVIDTSTSKVKSTTVIDVKSQLTFEVTGNPDLVYFPEQLNYFHLHKERCNSDSNLVYFPFTDRCYVEGTQGPCYPSHIIHFNEQLVQAVCVLEK